MNSVVVPWNAAYERLNQFYYRYVYDHSDLDIRISLKCAGCKKNFAPSTLLTAPVRGLIGGNLILTDSAERSSIAEAFSRLDSSEWHCPQCRSSDLQANWIGSSIEAYRLASLQGKQALLSPSPGGWEFVASDPGGGMDLNLPIAFDPRADVLIFPGYFSLIYWDPLTGKKLELKYDESDGCCDAASVLLSSSGEKSALIGRGYGGTATRHTTWIRMWSERVQLWHETFDVSWPEVADVSVDGFRIAVGTEDGQILVVSTEDGTVIARGVTRERKRVTGIAFAADGKSLLTTDECGLMLWSDGLSSPKQVITAAISKVHKLPSSDAALVRGESTIGLWNTMTGTCLRDLSSSDSFELLGWTEDVAVFPNGCFVAWNSGNLQLLDILSGTSVASIDLAGQGEDAQARAFSFWGGLIALVDEFSGHKWIWRVGTFE